MLWKGKDFSPLTVRAEDGPVGAVADLYFSDDDWLVRYLVLDGEGDDRVLLTPALLDEPSGLTRTLPVKADRDRIARAPKASARKPVSRHFETAFYDYYGWPYYWVGAPAVHAARAPESPPHPNLRSANEVRGYAFEGTDGDLGHVEDFIVDVDQWSIRYVEIDTRDWWPGGKKVLLARDWIEEVRWADRVLRAGISRDAVQNAPAYDESSPITPGYERMLLEHYGKEVASA